MTFGGYEWTSRESGHRHVLYFESSIEECYCEKSKFAENPTVKVVSGLGEFLQVFREKRALLIVHHPGWSPPNRGPTDGFDWGEWNHSQQRLMEIYSFHGSSETFSPETYTLHGDVSQQWEPEYAAFARDAIAAGYRMGITAGTDDHSGRSSGLNTVR